MWGTSYSGFNSLQIACERPPALKAICAIYASDDRWTDDVHWRGGALRLVDLVDYNHYMTPMCVLPPVPAVWGDGWREEWQRRLETNEPWVLTWLRENRDGPYWRHGSVRADGDGQRLRPDRLRGDDRGGLGRRLPQQLLPHRRGAAAGRASRTGCSPARGCTPTRPRPTPARASTSTSRWSPGGTAGCAAATRRRTEDGVDVFVRTSTRPEAVPRPARGPLDPRRLALAGVVHRRRVRSTGRARWPSSPTSAPPPGSTAPATSRGGSPPTSARTTPAR